VRITIEGQPEPTFSEIRTKLRARERRLSEKLGQIPLNDPAHIQISKRLDLVREQIVTLDLGVPAYGSGDMIGQATRSAAKGPESQRFTQRENE